MAVRACAADESLTSMFQVATATPAAGGDGGGGEDAPSVVNVHTGPVVMPLLFFATICQ
jgi:hypothetical protein